MTDFRSVSHLDLSDQISPKILWTNAVEYPAIFIMKEKSHYKAMLISIFPCSWRSAIPVGIGTETAAMFGMKKAAVQALFNFCGQVRYFK